MENQSLTELLQRGLTDEMNSAFQYIALAAQHGSLAEKKEFLRYAMDELKHASLLLEWMEQHSDGQMAPEISLQLPDQEDLYSYLIEYQAREESAVFYYQALAQLLNQSELSGLCQSISGEEQRHMQRIGEIYQKLKEKRSRT